MWQNCENKDKDAVAELAVLEKIKPVLEEGKLARTIEFTDEELPIVKRIIPFNNKTNALHRKHL